MKKKIVLGLTALILVVGLTIGGTLAFMQSTTQKVENTFTVGSVHLSLAEYATYTNADTHTAYVDAKQLTPGTVIAKTPILTVAAGSEECFVKAKIEIPAALQTLISDGKITIDYNTAWSTIDANGFVYYNGTVAKSATATVLPALFTTVTINSAVTNEDLATIAAEANRKITITGYAIQKATFDDAAAAWNAFGNGNGRA